MTKETKLWTKAPLPFTGQKRNFVKAFSQVISDNIPADGDGWTIVDVFGGSGLLAHNAKHLKPSARVIYNDFDGYTNRLRHICDTNRLRRVIQDILTDAPRNKKLSSHQREAVLTAVSGFNGFVDVQGLAAWLLFSGKQISSVVELRRHTLYNTVRKSDYPSAHGYLDGLDITHLSFCELLPEFYHAENTLLIFDPPYVCTSQGAYALDNYFGMVDFLHVMQFVRPPFVFFSSTKSEFMSYLDFLRQHKPNEYAAVSGYKIIKQSAFINSHAKYEDNFIYKFTALST